MPVLEKHANTASAGTGNVPQPSSPISPDSEDLSGAGDWSNNRSRTLFRSRNQLTEAAISTSSMERQKQKQEQPPVIKKLDRWGREVLIKNLSDGKYDINAGTIECLVESLADENPPDSIYIELFLLTFRHFMKPVDLVASLHRRFDSCASSIIRVRVTNVLKKWVQRHFYDFVAPEMAAALDKFLEVLKDSECAKYTQQITDFLQNELTAREKQSSSRSSPAHFLQKPSKHNQQVDLGRIQMGVDILLSWSPKRIAQELTLADLKLFRTIKPDEFCLFLWGDKKDIRLANFNAYIDRFNRLGFWVSSIICLQQSDIKRRAEVLEKVMGVVKHCYRLQNFNSLMALMSGLNTTPVSRLKKTWELASKSKYIGIYREIEQKMSYQSNFKAYRELEGSAKTPFIPFFGLYVKDLTFMNDGNQKFLKLPSSQPSPIGASSAVNIRKSTNFPSNQTPVKAALAAGQAVNPLSPKSPYGGGVDFSMSSSMLPGNNFNMASSIMPASHLAIFNAPITPPLPISNENNSETDYNRRSYNFSNTAGSPLSLIEDDYSAHDTTEVSPPIEPAELVNFEKCRSIFNKIHAIRIYQQSMFKFEEDKDDLDDGSARNSGGFFSNQPAALGGSEKGGSAKLLEEYFAEPNGPPAILDEHRLRDLSLECEPSSRVKSAVVPASSNTSAASGINNNYTGGSQPHVNNSNSPNTSSRNLPVASAGKTTTASSNSNMITDNNPTLPVPILRTK